MMLKVVDGERKRGPWIGVCLWLLLPMMASCQTGGSRNLEALVPPEAFTAENWYQVENPNPKQIIRIHGRAPDTLDIFITARYVATNAADDRCWRPVAHFGNELLRVQPGLNIRRNGGRYETELIVDKYLPGPCGWRYEASTAGVMRVGHLRDLSGWTWVIDSSRYNVDDNVPRCSRGSGPGCNERDYWISSNHDNTPVEIPCHINEFDDERADFICQRRRTGNYKGSHLLRSDTQEIQINFYDLDNDPEDIKIRFKKEL